MTLRSMDSMPELLSTVRLRDRGDVYLVVDLDCDRKTVELISITGGQPLIPDVPLTDIRERVDGPPGKHW